MPAIRKSSTVVKKITGNSVAVQEDNQTPATSVNAFTLDNIKEALPKNFHSTVSQKLVDNINSIVTDEVFAEMYRDNLITYQSVLGNGKYSVDNYIDAVSYCSFKFMGMTDKDAYYNAFPDRLKRLKDEGKNEKTISSYVHAYAKGKLVQDLLSQAMIPNYFLYQDYFHKAVMTQARLMATATSELVQTQAANSLLNALKQPDVSKMQISATISTDSISAIDALTKATMDLVAQQKSSISNGSSSAKTIAEAKIVEGEYYED